MTAAWNRQQTSIGHVTLRYQGRGAESNLATLRLRTERLLGSIDLQPPGLPPGALLIVRTLQAQKLQSLPGSVPHSSQPEWVDHLRTSMATLYRTAVHPALNPVTPAATSVLFVDAAEMLACLTRDVLNGRVWQQWYWQQMLRHVSHTSGAALTATWSEQAAFVPAMLGYLRVEEVRAAIALLTTQEVGQIISALNVSFDLPLPIHTPTPTLSTTSQLPDHRVEVEEVVERRGDPYRLPPSDEPSSILPPWQRWLSPVSAITLATLTPQAHYLLGLIITLHHAPAFARSTSFMTQALSWLDTELVRSSSSAEVTANAPETMNGNVGTHLVGAKDDQSPSILNSPHGTDSTDDIIFGASQPFPTEGLLTELGGILYLIHLLKWLDLPASWSASAMLTEHLTSWSIIELLARGLLGDLYDHYANDPIWRILALLDNREPDTLIDLDLPAQSVFRLPASWLLRYGPPHPSWIALTDGLRLYLVDEDAGYLIVDGPLGERSLKEVITREVDGYRVQGIQASIGETETGRGQAIASAMLHSILLAGSSMVGATACPRPEVGQLGAIHPHALCWLERVLGFVRYLLIRALDEPTIDVSSLPAYLLCKRGRLVASRTHVDLYMSMEQISLPIRRAGLDCDPSWVPDLARIVLFHFGQET